MKCEKPRNCMDNTHIVQQLPPLEPVCKMQCSKPDEQPCHHVCAQPRCKWECKEPKDCPKPTCHMKCEKPRNCMDNTHIVQQLPPLEPGETEGAAFHINKPPPIGGAPAPAAAASPAASANLFQAAASLGHGQSSSMR